MKREIDQSRLIEISLLNVSITHLYLTDASPMVLGDDRDAIYRRRAIA